MGRTTKERARALQKRPELARLRAAGGLTTRVVVDGPSLARWCSRVGLVYPQLIGAIVDAATVGGRELVLVTRIPVLLPPPHVVLDTSVDVPTLNRGHAFYDVDLPPLPSVIAADVDREPRLFDVLEGGARLLDVASGVLWTERQPDRYDVRAAAAYGQANVSEHEDDARTLARAIALPEQRSPRLHIVSSLHRSGDGVILDGVAVDDGGQRREAEGHSDSLKLLELVLKHASRPVMTTSMDLLDALYDAGIPLPAAVEDPALACVLLDPDDRGAPPGVGALWNALLGRRADHVRVPLGRALDALPAIHDELRGALGQAGLLDVYEKDVCLTAPLFAALEREGFHIDPRQLAADIASIEAKMDELRDFIVSGPRAKELRNVDLVHAKNEDLAKLIEWSDGALPFDWRTQPPTIDRLALYGNQRSAAVKKLRALDAIHSWQARLVGKARLRSVLEPGSTGRWYPHGDGLFSMPKHQDEAALLRRHLVPEPGHVFISGDFAAFEPRLLAHQSGDDVLVSGCQDDRDIYEHLMPMLGVKERAIAKDAVVAFIYGRGSDTFAADLPLPLAEGHRVFDALTKALPTALAFRDQVQATETDSAASMYGWRRRRGLASPQKFARIAFNLKMQASAADLLRRLMRALASLLPSGARVIHQEFDAVIVTCRREMAESVAALLKFTMENIASLSVPLLAKVKIGSTLWGVS